MVHRLLFVLGLSLVLPALETRASEELNPFDEKVGEEEFLRTAGELIVAASRYSQTTREAPAFVTVFTAEQLRRYGHRTLSDVVRSVSGFHVTDGRDYHYLGFRGLTLGEDFNTRVLISIDGHTVNEPNGASVHLDETFPLDLSRVERLEIVRGPASALYGSNAFYALINVVTRRPERSLEGEASAEYRPLRGGKATYSLGSAFAEQGEVMAGVVVLEEPESFEKQSYPAHDGKTSRTDRERKLAADLTLRWGGWRFLALTSMREKGLPHAPYETNFGSTENLYRDQQVLLDLSYSQELSAWYEHSMRLYYDRFRFEDRLDYRPDPLWLDENRGDRPGAEYQGLLSFFEGRSRTVFGLGGEYLATENLSREVRGDDPTLALVDIAKEDDFSRYTAFLQEELSVLPELHLTLGLRFDGHSVFENNVSPRGAAVYTPYSSGTFKLMFGEGFRNPTSYEAFFDDGGAYRANRDLRSERIRMVEAGYEHRVGAWTLYDLVYHLRASDLIAQEVVGTYDEDREVLQYLNRGLFTGYGSETGLRYLGAPSAWQGQANVTVLRLRQDGAEPAFSPWLLANASVSVPLFAGYYLSPEVHYLAPRLTRDLAGRTERVMLVNLALLADRLFLEGLEGTLLVTNLLDWDYREPAFANAEDLTLPSDGSAFMLRLRYRF